MVWSTRRPYRPTTFPFSMRKAKVERSTESGPQLQSQDLRGPQTSGLPEPARAEGRTPSWKAGGWGLERRGCPVPSCSRFRSLQIVLAPLKERPARRQNSRARLPPQAGTVISRPSLAHSHSWGPTGLVYTHPASDPPRGDRYRCGPAAAAD